MTNFWTKYNSASLYKDPTTQAYAYKLPTLEVDADGAPNAYGPGDTGLDYLANAGYPHGGWHDILVPDPTDQSKAYVRPSNPGRGFFISKTTLANPKLADTAAGKYADATAIPYIVFPGSFYKMAGTGRMGDFVIGVNLDTGVVVGGVVADIGPYNADLGEVSVAMVAGLGGVNPNPRNGKGVPRGPFGFIVFPDTHGKLTWPLDAAAIAKTATDLLADAGGLNTFAAAFEPAMA